MDQGSLRNLRRLFRSQVYCVVASVFGIVTIASQYLQSWPQSFVNQWTPSFEYFFALAVAHWVLSIVEDSVVGSEVCKSIQSEHRLWLQIFFAVGLCSHHLFAIFAYSWCLHTHYLSGLAVLGFLFEIPVLLLNYREVSLNFEDIFISQSRTFSSHSSLTTYWISLHCLWHLTRTAGCLLYLLSLLLWRHDIASALPLSSVIVYHLLGAGFNYINFILLVTVLTFFISSDFQRIETRRTALPVRDPETAPPDPMEICRHEEESPQCLI